MRGGPLRDTAEVLRDGGRGGERVLSLLAAGPKTIPEIARELRVPPREALLWVMALRRYGRLVELPKGTADDYYQYRRVEASP